MIQHAEIASIHIYRAKRSCRMTGTVPKKIGTAQGEGMKTQNVYRKAKGTTVNQIAAYAVCKKLIQNVVAKSTRATFFQVLVREIKNLFVYDRLCINLYDSEREILSLFTTAEGKVVSALTNARMTRGTVAELAISTRKPVVLNNIAAYFPKTAIHPLSEAGLNATIAIPLVLGREILGTLHCSFDRPPADLTTILDFLAELSPVLALCLFTVLAEERFAKSRTKQTALPTPVINRSEESKLLETRDMHSLMQLVHKVAGLDIPVLITGETGTGKSFLARYIHMRSLRNAGHFVKVNCPSLAPSLFESEFFGHAKGAFTGAHAKRVGRIELAQGGTLFLDEIGDLTSEMQSKLLQVLEEQSFERVGESSAISVDTRLVSATNINLEEAIAERRFRRDLFYRLAAVVIAMPPLRHRPNDIPLIVKTLVARQAAMFHIEPPAFSPAVLAELQAYAWPGNIRELRNVINRILIHSLGENVSVAMVQDVLSNQYGKTEERISCPPAEKDGLPKSLEQPAGPVLTMEEVERNHIRNVLRITNGVLAGPRGAATLLGLARTTLQYRMQKLGL